MGLTILIVSALACLSVYYFLKKWTRWAKMPPGPWGLPFVGYGPFIDKSAPYKTFKKLSEKYGPVFTISTAGVDQVVISDWELIRDAFSKTEFHHRPDFLLFKLAAEGHNGIVAASGKLWQDNRRFVMRTLRDFGFGRNTLDKFIVTEATSLADIFASHKGKPFDVDHSLNIAIVNIIWRMCAGQQFDHDNTEVPKLLGNLNIVLTRILDLGPLQLIPSLIPFFPGMAKVLGEVKAAIKSIVNTMWKQVNDHKATIEEGSPRDLIDAYLQERAKLIEQGEDASSFTDLQLRVNIQALFIAGSDTTSTSIRWALLYLVTHPEVQKKCQEEIDQVVGKDRLPSLELDNDKLLYLTATIHEIQRLANVAPTGLPHATADSSGTLGKYTIPPGTWIVPNIYACHMDPRYWPEPEKFDPTRFLNPDGTLKEKVPSFLPFSLGKRQCLGESLAKMELVLFLAVLLQRFEFKMPEGQPKFDFQEVPASIIRKPPAIKIVAIERV